MNKAESLAFHAIAGERDELLAACKQTLDWLSSFSMPPTSTIEEKQGAIKRLETVIELAEPEAN